MLLSFYTHSYQVCEYSKFLKQIVGKLIRMSYAVHEQNNYALKFRVGILKVIDNI